MVDLDFIACKSMLSLPFINVNKTVDGKLPLILASMIEDVSIVSEDNEMTKATRFLLDAKAELSAKDGEGATAASAVVCVRVCVPVPDLFCCIRSCCKRWLLEIWSLCSSA